MAVKFPQRLREISEYIFQLFAKTANAQPMGELCEWLGIRAGDTYYVNKYLNGEYKIHAGFFAGMRYLKTAYGSGLMPKLMGTYEAQVHPWLTNVGKKYSTVLNIGSAEGDYAVGLAWKFPNLNVIAYDISPQARNLCGQLMRLNQVKNVAIRSLFTAGDMTKYRGPTLIICDVEGEEINLLDPQKHPALLNFDYIIETHDHIRPVTNRLISKFRQTHTHTVITAGKRKQETHPEYKKIPPSIFSHLTDENRKSRNPKWLRLQRKK